MEYQTKWEKAFTSFLASVKARAVNSNKKLIWSGDLNVNPRKDDWSAQAFHCIIDKYPPNTLPAGFRDEDRKAY